VHLLIDVTHLCSKTFNHLKKFLSLSLICLNQHLVRLSLSLYVLLLIMNSLLETIYLKCLPLNAFIDRLYIGLWLRLAESKQVNNLLFDVEQSLFHSWHLRVIITHKFKQCISISVLQFLLNGLEFEAVESMDVVLGEVLKLGLTSNTDTCLVLSPDHVLIEIPQVF
jgi:hypothetical protein